MANARDMTRRCVKMYRGRDARDGIEKICRCTEVKMQEMEQKRGICKASCPRSLIVLLEVTCIDRLRLLNLVHVLKNCCAARECLLIHKGATLVGSELALIV